MSKGTDDLRGLINRRLKEAGENTFYGTVESVDEKACTCNVRVGGIVYESVLLRATEKDAKGFVVIPKPKSNVLISRIASSSRMYVEMFSEVGKVVCTTGETALQVAETGIKIEKGTAGLKKTLSDLCTAIAAITVSNSAGATTTPANALEFEHIKQELNSYLE